MKLSLYIFPLILLFLFGCASETNKIDVKGDSISTLKDTTSQRNKEIQFQDETEIAEENDMLTILEDYGTYIRKYSKRYGFDWRLILAVIKKESRFSLQAESHRGAFGLMQIMPETAKALADELELEEAISPRNNIAAGVYYLWKLYDNFDSADDENKIRLALGAYNCGLSRILDAQEIVRFKGGNANDWNSVSEALKLLSKSDSELHKSVFGIGKPTSGYFNDWEQPITYVNSVLKYYNRFKMKLAYNQ